MGRQRAVLSYTCPIIRPSLVPVRSNADHGLNSEAHAWFSLSNRLVFRIVRNVGRTVKQLIDAVSTVRPDHTAVLALCIFLDDVAIFTEESARLDDLDGLVQAFSRRFGHSYCICIC